MSHNQMMRVRLVSACLAGVLIGLSWTAPAVAADPDASRHLEPGDLSALSWRSVGPANMGGRVAAIALSPTDPKTYFVGYATGGLWKTTNAGMTFTPIFDKEVTSSIGSVAVIDAPPDWAGWDAELDENDPARTDQAKRAELGRGKIVWVGTGEGNGRNSSSWGAGVYRSIDGGSTFTHLGLEDARDIPALAVDPRNPDVCYVAALGHLWGKNAMRGVYKTTDGGKTFSAVLQIDENTGANDVVLDPDDPATVYAAMYTRRRTIGSFRSGGPNDGVYRSTNGGRTWEKITEGFPTRMGRIGLAVSPGSPDVVMAVVESDQGGAYGDFANRSRAGGVFRSDDNGETWARVSDFDPRPFYFSTIRIDPSDDQRVYLLGWQMYVSDDGGHAFRAGFANVPHVDFHTMAIDHADTDHLLIGTDGGLYVSNDKGKKWDFHNHMAVGQFYNISLDDSDLYRIGGGLQDNGTWIGPSQTITKASGKGMGRAGAITNADWRFIWGGDGFHVAFDPTDPNIVYAEAQGGEIGRVNLSTGKTLNLHPAAKEGEERFRFNWNAPFFISPFNPATLYLGGNRVFRLTDQGKNWEIISPDLSRRDPSVIMAVGSEAETAGTIVSLAESPLAQGMLWAGTDDGLIHVTTDDGATWKDVTPKIVKGRYVSRIEPSHHSKDTAYVAIDGHRSDSLEPVLLMTDDAGKTWRSISGDLPAGAPPIVVREDPNNPDVLYVGTEHAAYVTIDRGARWVKLNTESLPTVPVDDLRIQPRAMDLVAGTHGRSVWILDDISPISQLTPAVVKSAFHVFKPQPAKPRYELGYGGLWGDRMFIAKNPPMGASISYWIGDLSDEKVSVTIKDHNGLLLRTLVGSHNRGLNRVVWDLQPEKKMRLGNPNGLPEFVAAGQYTVTVSFGDENEDVPLTVLPAP